MAVSLEQFIAATGADLVAGNLIVGIMGDRRKVGDVIDGTFNLNEEGLEMAAEIEAGAKPTGRRRKAAAEPEAPAADAPVEQA